MAGRQEDDIGERTGRSRRQGQRPGKLIWSATLHELSQHDRAEHPTDDKDNEWITHVKPVPLDRRVVPAHDRQPPSIWKRT